MPWVGLRCVIVVFPDHTYFFSWIYLLNCHQPSGTLMGWTVEWGFGDKGAGSGERGAGNGNRGTGSRGRGAS